MQKVKYAGVSFIKKNNKYSARVRIDGESKYLGSFDTAVEAAQVREEYIKNHTVSASYYTDGIKTKHHKDSLLVELQKPRELNDRFEHIVSKLEKGGSK